jgi:uncharacterized protein YigE (DUF2233 family)
MGYSLTRAGSAARPATREARVPGRGRMSTRAARPPVACRTCFTRLGRGVWNALTAVALALVAGCAGPRVAPGMPRPTLPAATTPPTGLTAVVATVAPATSAPTPTPADSGWVAAAEGLERRAMMVSFPALGIGERLVLFRLDPAEHTFRVLYTPGFPAPVAQWDRQARLVFNAGYFDADGAALGLLVSDGRAFGATYEGFGGMFEVGADGAARLRSLRAEPYAPGEAFAQAVQSFPVLIQPDGTTFANEDGVRARRTVLAQDARGRLVVVIAPSGAFTLAGLAAWLARSDLELRIALNLDGGGSTGYYAGPADSIDSFAPVPAVIAAYARSE